MQFSVYQYELQRQLALSNAHPDDLTKGDTLNKTFDDNFHAFNLI